MAWDGKSRTEIELELRAHIEQCRGDYQRVFNERRHWMDTADAAGPNADGMMVMEKIISLRDALRDAQTRYKSSTKAFGDYILHGKLPQQG
jgi:hypothetical protein